MTPVPSFTSLTVAWPLSLASLQLADLVPGRVVWSFDNFGPLWALAGCEQIAHGLDCVLSLIFGKL